MQESASANIRCVTQDYAAGCADSDSCQEASDDERAERRDAVREYAESADTPMMIRAEAMLSAMRRDVTSAGYI